MKKKEPVRPSENGKPSNYDTKLLIAYLETINENLISVLEVLQEQRTDE